MAILIKQSVAGTAAETASLPLVNDESTYKDGVYEGSGKGFAGEIKVRVTITGGKIAAIGITSNLDGASYVKCIRIGRGTHVRLLHFAASL